MITDVESITDYTPLLGSMLQRVVFPFEASSELVLDNLCIYQNTTSLAYWTCLAFIVATLEKKNSAVRVRTRTVNVNMFSTIVKDEISEGR